MTPEHQNTQKEARKAVSTTPSFLLAMVVLATMSGTLGAPRSICLAATTLTHSACTIQVTFRALASRERGGECSSVRDRAFAEMPRELVTPAPGSPVADASTGHVRVACDLPPPSVG